MPCQTFELREALKLAPNSQRLKLDLAEAYFQQDKRSQAMVIVEDVVKRPDPPAAAHVLYARLLLRAGDVLHAVAHYKAGKKCEGENVVPYDRNLDSKESVTDVSPVAAACAGTTSQ